MRAVKFTVAICSWNRAVQLARCLEQLTRIQKPRQPWEIIVVDNNSTDETEQVLETYMGQLPLHPVREPTPGLSHARNTAVKHAAGEYVIWTDDDVVVDTGWLAAYERAIERWPKAAIFGGPVRVWFEGTPPRWLSANLREVGAAFAERQLGSEPFRLADDERVPWGANFAVRRRDQERVPYDHSLGRSPAAGALGEETAVIRALLRSGSTGWWVPDAAVEHRIPKERQTIEYLRSYYALVGKTYYQWTTPGSRLLRGRPLWLWRKALKAESAYALARLSGQSHRWVKLLVNASILRGAIRK